jgi:hypothetical protein
MSAVSGTRRAIKELVDGTIRVQIDIDPPFRKRFFELFPDIDMPIALAPLAPKAFTPAESDAGHEPTKGGALAKLAGQLCADPAFREWLYPRLPVALGGHTEDFDDPNDFDEESAASAMRLICGVDSRALLDHNAAAAAEFHRHIRLPWREHQESQ